MLAFLAKRPARWHIASGNVPTVESRDAGLDQDQPIDRGSAT